MASASSDTCIQYVGAHLIWPHWDLQRLARCLEPRSLLALFASCATLRERLRAPVSILQQAKGSVANCQHLLKVQQALSMLEHELGQASQGQHRAAGQDIASYNMPADGAFTKAAADLLSLEQSLDHEIYYVYAHDWELRPGRLDSKKGTWVKQCTKFSWELNQNQKFYVPQGVAMPVQQIARVIDPEELMRHEWGSHHLRVWLKPSVLHVLAERSNNWFVYWPHFEDRGDLRIAANCDTWLKRTTQMSNDMQNFELVYVPKHVPLQLACGASLVEEPWEKNRHQHVHLHRMVRLAAPPMTVKQENYEILIGQGFNREESVLSGMSLPAFN